MVHLGDVVAILESVGVRELREYYNIIAAALLHDAVEDTQCTYADLREEFGDSVAEWVRCVTDGPGSNRKERKAGVYRAINADTSHVSRLIKLADRLANIHAGGKVDMYRKEYDVFRSIYVHAPTSRIEHMCVELQEKIDALLL